MKPPKKSARAIRRAVRNVKSFSTRSEAEQHIIDNGLEWEKRARRAGGGWFLVKNETATVTRQMFTKAVRRDLRKLGKDLNWRESQALADALWNGAMKKTRRRR